MAIWPSMDPRKTAPFELGDGQRACLLLHGFTGSPWDLRPLAEALAPRGYRVRVICLPGHGGTPEDMAAVTYRDWRRAAESALLSLTGFQRTFVAGLSMGALLAVLLAARHPARVHGLALLAPALRLQGLLSTLVQTLHALPLAERLRPYTRKTETDIEDPAQRAAAPLLAAFPTSRLDDLWKLQSEARKEAASVLAPTLLVTAKNDHVVSARGGRELARRLKNASVRRVELQEGFHILPRDRGAPILISEISRFFDEVSLSRDDQAASHAPSGAG